MIPPVTPRRAPGRRPGPARTALFVGPLLLCLAPVSSGGPGSDGPALAALAAQEALAPGARDADAAQEADREAVLEVVERLFDGMRAADSAKVRSVFHPEARLLRAGEREGRPVVSISPVQGFVEAVGGADREWDEPIWDTEVRVEGNLATVWTKYAFYLDGEFSHCGVDAFILARTPEGWKIVSLADTSRREECWEPPGR